MLTEEMLAATIEALAGVERLILCGDPRQLPPIGAGRPFADLVAFLREHEAAGRRGRRAAHRAAADRRRRRRARFSMTSPSPPCSRSTRCSRQPTRRWPA